MADDGPPKPKPGSLKDRIKQFEASSSAQASTPTPPPLRPKPGTLSQWKPKPIDPPSPSKQTAFPTEDKDTEGPVKYGQGGMSTTDAVSSIAQGGGSLKERMAALQGKGAFGNPGATSNAPPLPNNEGKPRVWKTSKAPLPERKDDGPSVGKEDATTPTREDPSNDDADTSPKEPSSQDNIPEVRESNAEEGGEGETAGTEDEERERRAAIAARMARLGGARLGMPVGFGVATKGLVSPSKPKIVTPGDEESNADPSSSVVSPTDSQKDAPAPKPRTTLETALAIPLPTSQGSLLSPGEVSDLPSDSDAASSRKLLPPRSPSAPVPALPKRAAGPRKKKSGKETTPAATSSTDSETVPVLVPPSTESKTGEALDTAEAPSIITDEHVTEAAATKADDSNRDTESSQPSPPEAQEKNQPSGDEIALVVPSEFATPPVASPSMLTPADDFEDPDKSIEYPPERPTVELPSAGEQDEGQDGGTLTPRAEDDPSKKLSISTSVSQVPELVRSAADEEKAEEIDEEQEEALRKQRIAEKMARLGAVNPLSPGGYISPVSPHSTEKSKDESEGVEYEVEESGEDSEGLKATDSAKTSNVDDESKANVPVLSSVLSSQAYNPEPEINSPAAESSLQSPHAREQGEARFNDSIPSPSDAGANQEGSDEDADVDYPMLSPVEAAESGTHIQPSVNTLKAEVQPREKGAARSSSQHGDDEDEGFGSKALPPEPKSESEKPKLDLQTTQLSLDQEESEDHYQEQSNMPPRRITRAIPPPPPRRGSSASVSPLNSPARIGFDTPSGSVLAAALSRQAPPPPNRSSATPPPRSVSPTPSPPRRLFVREGAPSPPSLRSLSNAGDEEDSDERGGYHSNEPNSPPAEDLRKRSASPEPIQPIDEEVTASSPQTKPIPPPLPSGRPPVPNVRRSIPPPPRKSIPSPPRSMSKNEEDTPQAQSPIVVPTTPSSSQGRKSIGSTRQKSQDGNQDGTLQSTIRQAASRPPIPPPSRDAEKEVMDEEDGDPVDPQFVPNKKPSPAPVSAKTPVPRRTIPKPEETEKENVVDDQAQAADSEPEEDAEAARRRTIAERMAKLGGIKFGMAPPIRPPPSRKPQETADERSEEEQRGEARDGDGATEGDERSRRAAIAARMAAMGGLGFGMYGPGAVPATSTVASSKRSQSPPAHAPKAPLAAPPPIPGARPKQKSQEEEISEATSRAPPPVPSLSSQVVDDVMVEDDSESEIEMVNADIEDEGEIVEREEEEPEIVETPPALPTRVGRTAAAVTRPPPPPPVLVNEEGDPGSTAAVSSTQPTKRAAPSRSIPVPASPPSEYEVVGEESSSYISHVKGGRAHASQSGNAEPKVPAALESSGQWELPNIPSGSFDLGSYGKPKPAVEPDHSWTQVEQEQPTVSTPSSSKQPAQNAPRPFSGPAPPPVPNDELALLAYTLGSRIVASAHNVCEQSRHSRIGDGSSLAFLLAVATGAGASTTSLGHLVYAQTGGTVQKRLGDIMPGDVVALHDARFKGHKGGLGLGGYSSSWGTRDGPVLAIVSEFEGKKSKIKAYAVSQHPNSSPTIDTPSYKLEDLKSGVVKVFRMTEAEQ